jgi:hypothetical protein
MAKNFEYADRKEASFNLVTGRPHVLSHQHLFELRKAGAPDDPRQTVALNGKVYELIAELRRIATWLENQP